MGGGARRLTSVHSNNENVLFAPFKKGIQKRGLVKERGTGWRKEGGRGYARTLVRRPHVAPPLPTQTV